MKHWLAGLTALPFLLLACSDDNGPEPTVCNNIEGDFQQEGLTFEKPRDEPRGCQETGVEPDRFCTEVAPDFSCLGASEPLADPVSVTMKGCVIDFGFGGPSTANFTVAVFLEQLNGVDVDPGYDVFGAAGQQEENTPDARIDLALSTEVSEEECEDLGAFSLRNVPTETPLIIRVTDQNEERRGQVDTYQYNMILRNSAVKDAQGNPVASVSTCTPDTCFVTEQVNTINKATFFVIPRAAGVSTIRGEGDLYDNDGEGHVAGEVQDCSSANTVRNAVVSVDANSRRLTYFNVDFPPADGSEPPFKYEDPKPQSTRRSTNADGLYSALGVETQPGGTEITVGAAITPSVCGPDGVCRCNEDGTENPAWTGADGDEGKPVALATRKVFLFPDSVTILTFDRNLYTHP